MFRIVQVCRNVKRFSLPFTVQSRGRNDVGEAIKSVRSIYKQQDRKIDGFAIFLLVIPVSSFALGVWQVERKKWKEQLIADLAKRTNNEPVSIPVDLSEINDMEFHPVRVRGTFDHTKELYVGPRSLIHDGAAASEGGGIISSSSGTGVHVVTPFNLADRDLTILVNRGWVPMKQKHPSTRPQGQITNEVELDGIIRLNENRQPLTPHNRPETGLWMYKDLSAMSAVTGAAPIFIDAIASSTVPGGPIGGQTRITLRNEHLSYILTWFTLSGATAWMWYRHFITKVKAV